MPQTASGKKSLRQSTARQERNIKKKRNLLWTVKTFNKKVLSGEVEDAKKSLPNLYKTIDKMAKTKTIKKGKANRMKSRLTKKLNKK